MTKDKKTGKVEEIKSFEQLRERKREVDREIAETGSKVTRSTEDLLEEGAKVVAVGFVAFVISRLLNVFMSTSKKDKSEDVSSMASTADKERKSRTENKDTDRSGRDTHFESGNSNGEHSSLDTALIWLETISGGIEAAKLIINQIAEVKEQAQDKASSERSKEQETTR